VDLHRQGADSDLLDIDDAREVAQPVEELREVVIPAVDRDADRPLRVRLARRRVSEMRERQAAEVEVALIDQRLDLLDDLFGVTRGGEDATQLLELQLEALHFLAELRELALGGRSWSPPACPPPAPSSGRS